MRKPLQAILFFKNFVTGVMAPVLVLTLLAHGATLQNLSLVLGAYSLTIIAAEFPTGVFADLYGRRNAFLLALLLSAASYALLLFANAVALLLPAIILNGLGRAFASGSIDALAVETAPDSQALLRVTARISQLESAGLASGALLGGTLAGVALDYTANLWLCAGLSVLLLGLTLAFVREPRPVGNPATGEPTHGLRGVARQMAESFAFMRRRGVVRLLFALALITGMALFAVETYWQPALKGLGAPAWLLGALTCGGFVGVMAGNHLTERLLRHKPTWATALLLTQKTLLGAGLALLALPARTGAFVTVYLFAYFVLGGGTVAESMLLNRETPDRQRASVLSLFSFVTQVGGLFASLFSYAITRHAGYRTVWLATGGVMALSALLSALAYRRSLRHTGHAPLTQPAQAASQAQAMTDALADAFRNTAPAEITLTALATLAQTARGGNTQAGAQAGDEANAGRIPQEPLG